MRYLSGRAKPRDGQHPTEHRRKDTQPAERLLRQASGQGGRASVPPALYSLRLSRSPIPGNIPGLQKVMG